MSHTVWDTPDEKGFDTSDDDEYGTGRMTWRDQKREIWTDRKLPWAERVEKYIADLRQKQAKQRRERERRDARHKSFKRKFAEISKDNEELEECDEKWDRDHEQRQHAWQLVDAEMGSEAPFSSLRLPLYGSDVSQGDRKQQARRSLIGQRFDGFLALPPELRNKIYRNALVRGKVYMHNDQIQSLDHWQSREQKMNALDYFGGLLPRYQ